MEKDKEKRDEADDVIEISDVAGADAGHSDADSGETGSSAQQAGSEQQDKQRDNLGKITDKIKELAGLAAKKAAQGADFAKSKFNEAGGTEAIKGKTLSILENVRQNFKPDADARGMHVFVTRVVNLWKSGWTGQVVVLVAVLLVLWILSLFGGK